MSYVAVEDLFLIIEDYLVDLFRRELAGDLRLVESPEHVKKLILVRASAFDRLNDETA